MAVPFLWLFVCFAGGILAGVCALQIPLSLLAAAVVLCLLCLVFRIWKAGIACHLFLFFLLGHFAITQRAARYDENDLRAWIAANGQAVVRITGTVMQTPEISDDFFTLRLQILTLRDKKLRGVVRLTVSGHPGRYPVTGDSLEVFTRLRLPINFRNEGSFDYERYLRKEGIHALGSIKDAKLLRITGEGRSFQSWISSLRLRTILRIHQGFSPDAGGVLRAIWLDDRSGLKHGTEISMINAGIYHVIAISGFHVAILLFCVFLGLKHLFRFRVAILILCALMLFYFVFLEGRSSITRSFLMFLAFVLARLRYEPVPHLNTLSLAAWVQLIFNPYELFDPGFHLTYISTASILFVAVPAVRNLPQLPRIMRYLAEGLVVTMSIQFVLIPYQALVFHKIPFGSLIANLFAVPLSSFLIVAGLIFLPLPLIQSFFRGGLERIVHLFLAGSELFDGFWLKVVPSPGHFATVLFYGLLILVLVLKRKSARIFCLLACVAILLWIVAPSRTQRAETLRIHMVDVGQGDAILLEYPDGSFDLIDGGGSWNEEALDIGEVVLLPFLCEKGVTRLNRVYLTHAHADHMYGLRSLLRYFPYNHFYVSRQPLAEPGYQSLIRSISRQPEPLQAGRIFYQAGVRVRVLAPLDASRTLRVRNDDSLVLHLDYGGKKVLLTGDAEKKTEELLRQIPDSQADFLKVPHHGSKTSSAEAFLDHVGPKIAFVSAGKNNWFGHPHPDVLRRYRNRRIPLFRTDEVGRITITIGKDSSAVVETFAWK